MARAWSDLLLDAVHYLKHVAMGQHRFGVALHDFEIAARETVAIFRWSEQHAGFGNQAVRVLRGSWWRFLRECLINHHDEGGEFAQPLKGGFIQHQAEVLSGAGDRRHISFVSGALQFEERFVQTEQSFTQCFEAGAEVGHGTIVT